MFNHIIVTVQITRSKVTQSTMKSGWKKLLGNRDEDQREQEEAEEKELQELTDLAQQIPALQEIYLNAELNISIPDKIIFGDDSHMSEESEEEVQETKKKLSTEQLTEINHHVECLENIISQFDPDESRANHFLCQLQEMTKPYQALLALRNQLNVQPKITSFMKVKMTDIIKEQNGAKYYNHCMLLYLLNKIGDETLPLQPWKRSASFLRKSSQY
jgi:hypothetical protein